MIFLLRDDDLDVVFREYLSDFFRPFDQAEAVSGKVFLNPNIQGFLQFIDAVEIKVIDWEALCAAVLVDDGEGRAVNGIFHSEGLAQCFDEGGLAGSHLAVEGKDVALDVL